MIDAAINARAVAVADAVRSKRIPGVRDVVSTFRSVAVYFDPLLASIEAVHEALLSSAHVSTAPSTSERVVEVPVVYGGDAGPDISELAAMTGLTEADVARRHADATYRVFMLGFLPGFAYMASVDERIAVPRRASPRVRVPAGSVGIAGRQTGVYPIESPGGWQIVGRTRSRVFDPTRPQPCLFSPGDSVRFVGVAPSKTTSGIHGEPDIPGSPSPFSGEGGGRTITVINPGLFTTVQDEGRWGHQGSGVSVSGAMDVVAHRLANATVGNDRTGATLEVTLQGPELRVDHDAVVAVAGADLSATIDGASIDLCTPTTCRSGSMIRFGSRRRGTRTYLAVRGGIDLPDVLDSRSTHTMTHLGGLAGRQLRAGDRLPIGDSAQCRAPRRVGLDRESRVVRLRAIPGPQDDFFDAAAFDILRRTRFTVSPQSNRMGYRLKGGPPIPRSEEQEMISDATFAGALQVPVSGDPILLMADRQTTGGYPQIATVITADLPLAGQLAPGDSVEFDLCSRSQAIAALIAQEARMLAVV